MNPRTMLLELSTGRKRPMRPVEPVRSSRARGWDGFLVEEYLPAAWSSRNVSLLNNAVYLSLDGPSKLEWSGNGAVVRKRIAPGQISILPAGHPYSVRLRAAGGSVVVSFEQKLLAVAAADQGVSTPVEPVWVHGADDPLMRELVMGLREEMDRAGDDGGSYARSLSMALAAHIVRRYSATRCLPPENRHGLPPRTLQRVVLHVQDHLDEELSIERMAGVANLSACHFARMFKKTTGMAPHQYVLNSRVHLARRLLLDRTLSLAEVALRSGFCDQGHLTRCFRQVMGTTPAAFVREVAGTCVTR
jgi:AraC family transcriptional regulator